MFMHVSRRKGTSGLRAAVLVSVASITDSSTSVNDDRRALRKVCNAIDEAARTGVESIEVALTLGDSPMERCLAGNGEIAASVGQVILAELRPLVARLVHAGGRIRFSSSAPAAFGVALERARNGAAGQPLAVLVPHQMRGIGGTYLREMLAEYTAMKGAAAIVAGSVGMDALPCINWLACRGRRIFARSFSDTAEAPCDLSELRLTGRCILPPMPVRRCSVSHRAFAGAASLPQYLNRELASARKVIAREFTRRDASVTAPKLQTVAVCPNVA